MHVEEVKVVKDTQESVIYKKHSVSKHLNTQAATASLINAYFAPIVYNSSDHYKQVIGDRLNQSLQQSNSTNGLISKMFGQHQVNMQIRFFFVSFLIILDLIFKNVNE